MIVFIILLFIGSKVETDVGINASSVPVWIFRMLFLTVHIWGSTDHLFFSKVSMEDSYIYVANRFFCSAIPWFTLETDVEVDEGST